MKKYLDSIEQAETLDQLDQITETAANKAQGRDPLNKREGTTSSEGEYEKYAHVVAEAIRTLASKPDNLDNLESYLAYSFGDWMEKYARYPEALAAELQNFADMDI